MVGAALKGAAKRIPSRRAILYKVLLGMPGMKLPRVSNELFSKVISYCVPYALLALFADIVPVRKASRAEFKLSSVQDFVGPSFFGVSMPSRCALCHKVVEGIPYVAEA